MTTDADEWWQQLAQTVDRMLSRVHVTDPLLYAELLKVRRRLEPRLSDMADATSASRGGGGHRMVGPRPSALNKATWTIARH